MVDRLKGKVAVVTGAAPRGEGVGDTWCDNAAGLREQFTKLSGGAFRHDVLGGRALLKSLQL